MLALSLETYFLDYVNVLISGGKSFEESACFHIGFDIVGCYIMICCHQYSSDHVFMLNIHV